MVTVAYLMGLFGLEGTFRTTSFQPPCPHISHMTPEPVLSLQLFLPELGFVTSLL